jgi:hypothetical protein
MWQRLAVCPDVTQLLAVMALRKPILSSLCLHPDCDVERLAVCPDVAELLAVVELRNAVLSPVCLHLDCNVAEGCQSEYLLGLRRSGQGNEE